MPVLGGSSRYLVGWLGLAEFVRNTYTAPPPPGQFEEPPLLGAPTTISARPSPLMSPTTKSCCQIPTPVIGLTLNACVSPEESGPLKIAPRLLPAAIKSLKVPPLMLAPATLLPSAANTSGDVKLGPG